MARVVYDFYMTQAARALEIACDSRKRKSYRLNRPLKSYDIFCDVHDSRKRVVGLIYTKQYVS